MSVGVRAIVVVDCAMRVVVVRVRMRVYGGVVVVVRRGVVWLLLLLRVVLVVVVLRV